MAPTIGAVTTGFEYIHASATCAIGHAPLSATWRDALDDGRRSDSATYSDLPNSSVADRSVTSSHGRASRPRASGLHGSTPMPWSAHSGSISRSSSRLSRL